MPDMMRAITVEPGVPDSLRLEEFRVPEPQRGAVLIRGLALGVCGTDRDIIGAKYGAPPAGHRRLIIGHESLGRVEDAPPGCGVAAGDLVVGIVRQPDPVPCSSCAVGEWDMCRNGLFTEHGINQLDGFGSEYYRLAPEFVIRVDESLGAHGVLTEPTTVVAKAWEHITKIGERARWAPRRVLVTGAGPVGLLAALLSVQRKLETHVLDRDDEEPKPSLVRDLGATFHTGGTSALPKDFDVVLECTGASTLALDVVAHTALDGIVCLLGVTSAGKDMPVDVGAVNSALVLGNRVLFGSVNANRRHYEAAVRALAQADAAWLDRVITQRVSLDDWRTAFDPRPGNVKTVIELAPRTGLG
jgi:threonine dehydrogenase-like Zn-dependent dehydrogenase